MTKNFISFVLSIFGVIVVAALISAFFVIEYGDYTRQTEEPLLPEKTMEIVDSYDIVTSFGDISHHTVIHVYHDNDRNVTCYLYGNGISCIPDWFFEEVEK